MPTYRCKRCQFLYIDERREIPFEELDDKFKCPRCRCSKKMFEYLKKD